MKKIIFLAVIIISLVIIVNLITSIYTLWHKQDVLTQAELELGKERAENQQLKKQLSVVTSQSFVEEQARDKLFLIKPGQQEVLIDHSLVSQKQTISLKNTTPYWQQWLAVFSL